MGFSMAWPFVLQNCCVNLLGHALWMSEGLVFQIQWWQLRRVREKSCNKVRLVAGRLVPIGNRTSWDLLKG